MAINSVDRFYLSTREIYTEYNVENKKQLEANYALTIVRKSKRIEGKVCKVYLIMPLQNCLHSCLQPNTNIEQFAAKLNNALGLLYKDNLVRVNLQAFGNTYDVVVGDFNLVIGYDRIYTIDELRPVMDMHKDYEINYGQNCTGEEIRFNSSGKLVSDLGYSYFHVTHINQSNEDTFIYCLLIDLSNTTSDRETYLNRIGYMANAGNYANMDYGSPTTNGNMPAMWERVKFNYGEYLYPGSVTGFELVVSNLLFNDEFTKEQAQISLEHSLDSLMAMFGGKGKYVEQVEAEKQVIREAVYKLYGTKSPKTLAKRIGQNPTKLAVVQAQIEKQGNQQWRDVNKLLDTIGLTAWVDINGMVSVGVYGDMIAEKLSNGITTHHRQITWTEPEEQANVLQLGCVSLL